MELEDIANEVKENYGRVSELFPTKKELILGVVNWKMESIGEKVDVVVQMKMPLLEKLVRYLEVMYDSTQLPDRVTVGRLVWNEELLPVMNSYIKKAVYTRFNQMLEEAKNENLLRKDLDVVEAFSNYWYMLSSILINDSDEDPIEINSHWTLSEISCSGILRIYRDILTKEANNQLDSLLKHHAKLSNLLA